ncbi:hypothetical protein [Brevundimonas vesicularis]|uniref:hypothetical protein n=1 Tax=Brevundimonas vesicularis TaxID=41276 RepID=UPI0028AE9970|nr:hypothetical protein [Brevundimonas vesicularis]
MTLIGMGIRLVMMFTIQQRRERMNRQINERLKTLIAAYKVLGGSFTGDLTVDPTHKRDLSRRSVSQGEAGLDLSAEATAGSDRTRRIRDAVEASLADIILLGTEDQVRLAQQAARELVAGRPVRTHDLVVSLRDFIRQALDLAPVPTGPDIPLQGPTRPSSTGGRGAGAGAGVTGGRSGGGGGMGAGMGGGGMGMGGALGDSPDDPADPMARKG